MNSTHISLLSALGYCHTQADAGPQKQTQKTNDQTVEQMALPRYRCDGSVLF